MEIPKGYKQTEVGVIPQDWDVRAIRSLASKLVVGFVGTCEQYYTNNNGILMIRTGDLKESTIDTTSSKHVTIDFHERNKKSQLKKGDVLIARHGSNGHGVIYDYEEEANALNIVIIRTNESLLDNRFLVYSLKSSLLQSQIEESTAGSTQKVINTKAIGELVLLLPSINEQKKIADVLSNIDKLIAELGEQIEKKRQIKEGAMQHLLTGKTRLPGFSQPWREVQIGKIGYTYPGITGKSKDDFNCGDAMYITFLNVLNNPVIDTSIFERVNISPTEGQNAAHKGDLFFNTSSETPEEVGICAVLNEEIENLYLNSFCFGYRLTDETVLGHYLAYFWRCKQGREIMTSLAQGATRYNLSKAYFNKVILMIPQTKDEQSAIVDVLSTMDDEIHQLETERDKYTLIKQGMMQELLTGKTRLL